MFPRFRLFDFLASFPFLFGGTFIEGENASVGAFGDDEFPFLFGGTFIEGYGLPSRPSPDKNFPSFSEGLSLRVIPSLRRSCCGGISLPFRRDFH